MIIILEGPDGSGKTTLAKKLQEQFKLGYHHEGPPPPGANVLQYYIHIFDESENIVLDRFVLGEAVYGPILRNCDKLGLQGYNVFQEHVIKSRKKVFQIICLPPVQVAYSYWSQNTDEMLKTEEDFYESYARYSYFLLRTLDFNIQEQIWYDWTKPSHILKLDRILGSNDNWLGDGRR